MQTPTGWSVSVTDTSTPASSATDRSPLATTPDAARPSTRRRIDVPASAGDRMIEAVSCPLVSGRGGSGSVPDAKAGLPLPMVPETSSAVRSNAGS